MSYGFIITRHVNSETTNQYWNHCIQCIRKFYIPEKYKIIVIDDNSNQKFIKAEFEYRNIEIVQSEYPGRGELLPYYYFLKNYYFENAVILHDSVFIHKKIKFSNIKAPVLPLWHFYEHKTENLQNTIRLNNYLKNNYHITKHLTNGDKYNVLSFNNAEWYGCFGVQSYINYQFLKGIQEKYNIFNLIGVVKNRTDRCCLERIFGSIFYNEFPRLISVKSLLGDISSYQKWGYTFKEYIDELKKNKKVIRPVVKVWTGR